MNCPQCNHPMKDHSLGGNRLVCFTCTCEVYTKNVVDFSEAELEKATRLIRDLHDEGMLQDAFDGDQESIDLLVIAENWLGCHGIS